MAIIKTSTAISNDEQGFNLNLGGGSLRQQAEMKVMCPALQEYTIEDGIKKFTGNTIVGDEALKICYSWIAANAEPRLERFDTACQKAALVQTYVKKDRSIKPGETLQARANRYMIGIVLSGINSIPNNIEIDGRSFIYTKVSRRLKFNPTDLMDVMSGNKSFGQGPAIEADEDAADNMLAVPKDVLIRAIAIFKKHLNPTLVGNTLQFNGKDIVSFSTADQNAKIVAAETYSLNDVSFF